MGKIAVSKKIKAPEGYAAGRDMRVKEAPAVQIHCISGGTNIIGSDINIQVTMPKPIRHRHHNKAHVVHELHLTILCK